MHNQLLIFRTLTAIGQLSLLWLGDWLGFSIENAWVWLVPVVYILLVYSGHFWLLGKRRSMWLLLIDLLVWVVFFALLNGISNPLIWCLMLPIMLSGISQSIGFTWLMSLLSNLSYVLLWTITPSSQAGMHPGHETFNAHVLGMWVGFVLISNLLSYITTQLMQTIHDKNRQLLQIEQKRSEDQHIMTMATMATGLAHELGTPLSSIKLLANELSILHQDKPDLVADLNVIDEQLMRCQATIKEMVELSNDSDYLNSREISLKTLLSDVIGRFNQNHHQAEVTIDAIVNEHVMTDSLLELALLNILNNSAAAKARKISIKAISQLNQIAITISDNGLGNQFDQASGLGIGLKLSRRILTSAGGNLTVRTHNHGADAVVILARMIS